jgi:hypothetical protein
MRRKETLIDKRQQQAAECVTKDEIVESGEGTKTVKTNKIEGSWKSAPFTMRGQQSPTGCVGAVLKSAG